MSATRIQTVELPLGVSHYQTSAFAKSWEAYDALIAEDGWCLKDAGTGTRWKEARINGHLIVVHEPLSCREEGGER